MNIDIVSINNSTSFLSVRKRYYKEYVLNNEKMIGIIEKSNFFNTELNYNYEDYCFEQYIIQHHNGLCIVGLMDNHSALNQEERKITRINFNVKGKNRLDNKVTGKRKKRGGTWLEEGSIICVVVTTENGDDKDIREWPIYTGIRGMLMQPNSKLDQEPSLLLKSLTEGFVAIIKTKDYSDIEKLENEIKNNKKHNDLKRNNNNEEI
eukprot:TRINITY_DN2580_c0_g1_i1.p1 TRINITY_DN2580_c0_g1~~TRINITY_DN2580_c0_g1_i1.p1  ORF type:complete len:207 (+),score=53.66 TRINITY_DN2580_c0_g1_i1:40-660(+)